MKMLNFFAIFKQRHNNIVYKLLLQLVVVVDRLRSFFNVFFKGKRKRSILCFVTTCVSVEISRSSPSTLEDHEIYVILSICKNASLIYLAA